MAAVERRGLHGGRLVQRGTRAFTVGVPGRQLTEPEDDNMT